MGSSQSIRKSKTDSIKLMAYFEALSEMLTFQADLAKLRKKHKVNSPKYKTAFEKVSKQTVSPDQNILYSRVEGSLKLFKRHAIKGNALTSAITVADEKLLRYVYRDRKLFASVKQFSEKWGCRVYEAMWVVVADAYPPYFGMGPLPRLFNKCPGNDFSKYRKDNQIREKLWPKRVRIDKKKRNELIMSLHKDHLRPAQILKKLADSSPDRVLTEEAIRKVIFREKKKIGQ